MTVTVSGKTTNGNKNRGYRNRPFAAMTAAI